MKLINKMVQRGLTLFEALLVMFVGAIVIGGVIVLYNTVQNNVKAGNLTSGIQQIAAGIHSIYLGSTSATPYSTLTTTIAETVAPTGATPDWAKGYTPYWTATYASVWTAAKNSADSGITFAINVGPIPAQACTSLVAAALAGGALYALGVANGTTYTTTNTDPGTAAAGCNGGANSFAVLVYN